MKIGVYISELLFTHDTVILPGFGAFTKQYLPAKFIPEKKIVESPKAIAAFSPEPKHGDTPLTTYLAKKEGVSIEEATNYLDKLAKEMEHAMEAGNKVELKNIGSIYRKTDGLIEFEPNMGISYLAGDTGVAKVKTPPVAKKSEPTVEPKKDEPKKDHTVSSIISDQTGKPSASNNNKTKTKTPETMNEPYKNEGSQLHPALKWIAIIALPLIVILLVLILGFGVFSSGDGFFRKSEKVDIEKADEVDEISDFVDEAAYEEMIIEDAIPAFDPYAEPVKPEVGKPVYYIVVGSFRNYNLAQDLALKLRKEGAHEASVLGQTYAGFYRTYYGFYYDLNEAKAEKARLDSNLRDIAWILHR